MPFLGKGCQQKRFIDKDGGQYTLCARAIHMASQVDPSIRVCESACAIPSETKNSAVAIHDMCRMTLAGDERERILARAREFRWRMHAREASIH